MLDFRSFDNLALVIQFFFAVVTIVMASRLSWPVRINCFLLFIVFIFPSNLIAQTVTLSLEQNEVVPRSWLYKQKLISLGGEAFGPIYFLLVGMSLFNAALIGNDKHQFFRLFKLHLPVFCLFLWGMLTALNNPYAIEYKNLGFAIRELFAISCGLGAGMIILLSRKSSEIVEFIVKNLCIITLIGSLPFVFGDINLLLRRDFSAIWMLPSQSAVLPGYLAVALWMFRHKSKFNQLLAFAVALLAILSESKDAWFIYVIFIITKCMGITSVQLSRFHRQTAVLIIVVVAVCYICPILINHYFLTEPLPSLETRYFQMINAVAAVWNGGITRFLLGLGWNQWYPLSVDFPFKDFMSGPIDEVNNVDARYMISVPFIATIRSIGVLGLVGMILFMIYVGDEVMIRARRFGPAMAVVFYMVLIVTSFMAITGSVEVMMLVAFLAIVMASDEVVRGAEPSRARVARLHGAARSTDPQKYEL